MKTNLWLLLVAFIMLFVSGIFQETDLGKIGIGVSIVYIIYSAIILSISAWKNK